MDDIQAEVVRQRAAGYRDALRTGGGSELPHSVQTRINRARAERAARDAERAAAGYIGPDMHGQAIHAGDFVKWGGRVWRAESEQLRWVVNGMLTAPLCTVGTSQTERLA